MENSIDPVINIYALDNEMFLNVISWSMIFELRVESVTIGLHWFRMARKTAYGLTKCVRRVFIHKCNTFFFVLYLCTHYYRVTGFLCALPLHYLPLTNQTERESERAVKKRERKVHATKSKHHIWLFSESVSSEVCRGCQHKKNVANQYSHHI